MTREEILATAKPILFNTEMVRAILDGKKSCTRRVVSPHYRDDEIGFQVITNAHTGEFIEIEKIDEDECDIFSDGTTRYVNPPYQVGNYLYVRETWGEKPAEIGGGYIYKADIEQSHIYKWCPSIHMPKVAARIFLRVTGVRAERLQDITTAGIRSEGIHECFMCGNEHCETKPLNKVLCSSTWIILWDSTIKKQDLDRYGWEANPWVWVIEFERVNTDE